MRDDEFEIGLCKKNKFKDLKWFIVRNGDIKEEKGSVSPVIKETTNPELLKT